MSSEIVPSETLVKRKSAVPQLGLALVITLAYVAIYFQLVERNKWTAGDGVFATLIIFGGLMIYTYIGTHSEEKLGFFCRYITSFLSSGGLFLSLIGILDYSWWYFITLFGFGYGSYSLYNSNDWQIKPRRATYIFFHLLFILVIIWLSHDIGLVKI